MRKPEAWGREAGRDMAELGLLGMPFAEHDGGFGGGGVETMIVMAELGRGLVLEPYLSTVILAGGVIRHAGSAEQKQARIAPVAAGDLLMALAHQEPDGPPDGLCHKTCAVRQDTG